MGLTPGSYEAYCLDQAVWYAGTVITEELNKAGQKKQKGEAQVEAARKRVISKYLDKDSAPKQFADPAAFFGSS